MLLLNFVFELVLKIWLVLVVDQVFNLFFKFLFYFELEEIWIEDNLFVIGWSELFFVFYELVIVVELFCWYVCIFSEFGVVYFVDLGSKNGIMVNGVVVW